MKIAKIVNTKIQLLDLVPVVKGFKVVDPDQGYYNGKKVKLTSHRERTMKRSPNNIGWGFDPNGVDKTVTKAVYFRNGNGHSIGFVVEDEQQALTAFANYQKTSVAYYD